MLAWALALCPVLLGALLGTLDAPHVLPSAQRRRIAGALAVAGCIGLAGLAAWAAVRLPGSRIAWGPGLHLSLRVDAQTRIASVLIPCIAAPVVAWAAAHEAACGLSRLLGLLVAFTGAMELLVLAYDLLTLIVAWELVSAISWGLIGHRWRDSDAAGAASYAYGVTRLGGLGLLLAAGAALAGSGSFAFARLPQVAAGPWGDLLAAGILLAALTKSAQVPFVTWLFRAMAGPSSASALLHSSTMVAAGAWLLIRLHGALRQVPWLEPTLLIVGLTTALAAGIVALCQPHAKRLLAASTSAQYGLMIAAVGAGFSGAATAHLVSHAAFKALLFLAAGIAIAQVPSGRLRDMRLGARLPHVALASAVGALALAAVPPLGGAWSKEQVVAATGHVAPALALLCMAAGTLSAGYATRFQLLAYGRNEPPRGQRRAGHGRKGDGVDVVQRVALAALAAWSLLLGLVWLPDVQALVPRLLPGALPEGKRWEQLLSITSVCIAVLAAWGLDRRGRLVSATQGRLHARLADWLGLPALSNALVVRPTMKLAAACARFDDRVVAGGVRLATAGGRLVSRGLSDRVEPDLDRVVRRLAAATSAAAGGSRRGDDAGLDRGIHALAAGVGRAASHSRRLQGGALPRYYLLFAAGLLALLLILWLGG